MALDKNKNPLSVGSRIHVTGVVTKIHHDDEVGVVELEFDIPGTNGGKASILCNSNQVEEFDGNPVPPPPPPGGGAGGQG